MVVSRTGLADHRGPGLLRLGEGVAHTRLAGQRELELLVEAAHQVLGLGQADELVGRVALLVDVEGGLEPRVAAREVGRRVLVAGEAVRDRAQLRVDVLLSRYCTNLNASALCSPASEMPMPH